MIRPFCSDSPSVSTEGERSERWYGRLEPLEHGHYYGFSDGRDRVAVRTAFIYTDAETKQSVLLPDSKYSYIRWDDDTEAEWIVDDAFETTVNTYRYTASQVATMPEYGRQIRERFAFELSGLPEAQREIVQAAIEEGEYVVEPEATPSGALAGLADRFREQEQAHTLDETGERDLSGPYLVRFDGEVYWTILVVSPEMFETESGATEQT